jgi:hypothetical protein
MRESEFQAGLIKELKQKFPGCLVLKNDSSYMQGIPDISIFYKSHWAMLEVKKSAKASRRPNQQYYIDKLNEMSYAAFICPENKETIMGELIKLFNARGGTHQ